ALGNRRGETSAARGQQQRGENDERAKAILHRASLTEIPAISCRTGDYFASALPNAAKISRLCGLSRHFHSGCHCTPSRKPFAFGIETASICPSGATASAC